MKIVYFAQEGWEEEFVKGKLQESEVRVVVGTMQDHADLADAEAEVLSVFVNSHVGATELDRFPNLKLIATRSTGFDHIDLAEAKKRNIAVTSVPSYGVNTVAEFAFALILALSRRICESHERVSEDGSFSQEGLEGFDLAGKTLGLVGCGNIGIHTARIAKGFGMDVIVFDVRRDEELARSVGFEYAELDDLLSRSDIISLHVPYNPHTHHLINMNNIARIKRGAYLINTARGAVVETDAIVKALEGGILAGAGLDVLEEEGEMGEEEKLLVGPHPSEAELRTVLENHYLMKHPRVIITPHVAFDTREAIERILTTTVENIVAWKSGKPQNVVA
ncbi:MAG TPA: NAD(P)-dependent oxidoreductase [Candidatus Paceibacterota bacterium]